MHLSRSTAVSALVIGFVSLLGISCDQAAPSAGQTASASGEPPIFDHRAYDVAKKAAEEEKKLFIVKATAVWCAPCKQMDKTTWRDPRVVDWLKDRAIIVALDVDKEQSTAKSLQIAAMPTMVAFKDGAEFDRIVGYRSADDLLIWLGGIERGEKSIELVKQKAGSRDPKDGPVDVQARYQLAHSLEQSGDIAKATDEYVWLWQHMLEHNPAMAGVRGSFMVADMQRLAARDGDTKKRFTVLRDETRARLGGEKVDPLDVRDFIALNQVIDDGSASLAWFDEVKGIPRWKPMLSQSSLFLRELLAKHERWADIGAMLSDPATELQMHAEILKSAPTKGMDEDQRRMMMDMMTSRLRDEAAVAYVSLLAAQRDEEASKVLRRAVELDESPKMLRAIVEKALAIGQPREELVVAVKSAEAKDADLAKLRERVEAALKEKH